MYYKQRSVSVIIKTLSALAVSGLILLGSGFVAQAQGLILDAGSQSTFLPSQDYVGLALVAARFILATVLGLAGVVGIFNGYKWLTNEGNAAKAFESKHSLGRAILIITIVFILMAVMRIYIPDYSTLTF